MSWPTPQDYNEAVQNPQLAFRDPELREGKPELTSLGLPRPITGGFATVYKLQCRNRAWAVRCFLRPFHDYERRYAAISDHLHRVRLPCTVGFAFQREGIRVGARWYPILKMEWVQGERLDAFIGKHLGNPDRLLSVARHWVELIKALRDASIAHGDLQHGNVLVVANEDLRLVDYDGMYVPALQGESSHEVGHRNYQHPLRTEADFGLCVDNFSAWVVYVSLTVLARDPGLWQRFKGGDECLLFRRRDFEQPESSDILHSLVTHRNEQIRSIATLFRSLLYLGLQDIPSLYDQILSPTPSRTTTAHPGYASWIEDHQGYAEPSAAGMAQDASRKDNSMVPAFSDPSWILDALTPSTKTRVTFQNSAAPERVVLAVSVVMYLIFTAQLHADDATNLPLDLIQLCLVVVVLINLTLWVCLYCSDSSVLQLSNLTQRNKEIKNRIRTTECEIQALNRAKAERRKHVDAEQARIKEEVRVLEGKERKEIEACQAKLQSTLSSIYSRRHALSQRQARYLEKIKKEIEASVAALDRKIATLDQAENTELSQTLQAKQKQHITTYLSRFRLDQASISDIGPVFAKRLMNSGFHTAADIDYYRVQRVHGIGPTRAKALADWRASIEVHARSTMPSSLYPNEKATIHAKYADQRRMLQQQRDSELKRQRQKENEVQTHYRPLLEQLKQEERVANEKAQTAISEIRTRYTRQYVACHERDSKLGRETKDWQQKIDESIGEAHKVLSGLHWKKASLDQEIKAYDEIRFWKYVKRIFFG